MDLIYFINKADIFSKIEIYTIKIKLARIYLE